VTMDKDVVSKDASPPVLRTLRLLSARDAAPHLCLCSVYAPTQTLP